VIYVIADILKTIRHEVGMSPFGELESNEALSFFVNNVGMNPISKIQAAKAKYDIKMIKFEIYMFDRYKLVYLNKFFYTVVKPVFGGLSLMCKYVLVIPLGKLLILCFPSIKKVSVLDVKDKE